MVEGRYDGDTALLRPSLVGELDRPCVKQSRCGKFKRVKLAKWLAGSRPEKKFPNLICQLFPLGTPSLYVALTQTQVPVPSSSPLLFLQVDDL